MPSDDRIIPIPPEWTANGWSTPGWAARLRQMADRCEACHPDRADELRRMADGCDGNGSVEDLHEARMQRTECKRTMPKPHKGAKRQRAGKAQRCGEGLLFGTMEEAEDDGA